MLTLEYPRFHEAVAAGVAPVGPELNLFVDTVLEQVNLYGGDRRIILSSFTPEICILLSVKQKAYPVFFITNAGKLPVIDIEKRAASMQVAVNFAKLWDLAGIVFASEPLVLCPRLVGYVKSPGPARASYGPLNNLPEAVIVSGITAHLRLLSFSVSLPSFLHYAIVLLISILDFGLLLGRFRLIGYIYRHRSRPG